MTSTRSGGAPYFSSKAKSSAWFAVSKALTRSTKRAQRAPELIAGTGIKVVGPDTFLLDESGSETVEVPFSASLKNLALHSAA